MYESVCERACSSAITSNIERMYAYAWPLYSVLCANLIKQARVIDRSNAFVTLLQLGAVIGSSSQLHKPWKLSK